MNPALHQLGEDYFAATLAVHPFSATVSHLPGYDAEVPDVSEEGEADARAGFAALRDRARALPEEGLDPVERVSRAMLETLAQQHVEELDTRTVEFTSTPFFFGAQAQILGLVPKATIATTESAEDYVSRCAKLSGFLEANAERLRQGVKHGRTPVAQGVEGSITQIERYLALPLDEDPLMGTLATSDAATEAYRAEAARIVGEDLRPAMARFRDVLRDEVLPHARPDDRCGLSWLDGGADLYRKAVHVHTTTERTPDELHALGLDQIARLEDEYREIAAPVLGTDDLREIYARLRDDAALHFDPADEAVRAAERAVARATEAVPDWFGRLPSTPCEVRPMPEIEARGHTVAYYSPPGATGTHGTYWINTFGPVSRRFDAEVIAFHEALPGHHLQVALAGEMEALPRFRRYGVLTAYAEGWGLYTERLADEMGLYSSELDRIGMLSCDSMRACRLVVDTGLHHLGWSRQRAVDYMVANSPLSRAMVESEVARYIVYPGQALGYMVGRLELLRMRAEARRTMGTRFDLTAFHDTVLGQGALPLTVLDDVVTEWASA